MLELGLEEAHDLSGLAGRAGDGHGRMVVRGEDLVDAFVRDAEPFDGPPVARHDDAAGELEGEDGRAVRYSKFGGRARHRLTAAGVVRRSAKEIGEARIAPQRIGGKRRAGATLEETPRHSPPFCT